MLSLLIIDDDVDLAEALAEMIEALGHTAKVCFSGTAAMSTLSNASFDVILLDYKLSDGPGTMWLEQIVEVAPKARKVIITGFVEAGVKEHCAALGADALLLKPFSVRQLVEQLVINTS